MRHNGSFDRTRLAGHTAHYYQCGHAVLVTPHEKALLRAFCSLWFIVRWYNADQIFTSVRCICLMTLHTAHYDQCDHAVLVTPREKALLRAFCSLWFIVRWYNADQIFTSAGCICLMMLHTAHYDQCGHAVLVTPHEKALLRAFCSLWFIVRWYNADQIFTSVGYICLMTLHTAHYDQCDHAVLVTPREKALVFRLKPRCRAPAGFDYVADIE